MSLKGEPELMAQIREKYLREELSNGKISREEYDRELQTLQKYLGVSYIPPEPKKNPLWTFIKILLGFAVGFVVWYLVYMITRLIIALIAQVPFLRTIVYYPSDASWALTVLPPINAVSAGAFCSIKICRSAKLFSVAIILLYILHVVNMFIASAFSWSNLIIALISIGIAVMSFFEKEDQ